MKNTHNKLSKYTPPQTERLRGTPMSGRPLARRYMRLAISFLLVIFSIQSVAQIYADEVSRQIAKWNEILRNDVPSYIYDSEVIEWGKKKGLSFKYAETASIESYDYELVAKIGTFKSNGIDCDYYTVYARVALNKFKQTTGSQSVGRDIECAKGI